MLKIIIPGIPIAKHRPRFARRGKGTAVYSDQETEEDLMLWHVKQQTSGHRLFKDAVLVDTKFFMPRPKSHFGTGRNAGKLKPSASKYHIKKPDTDNLVKFLFDIFNGSVWKDDSQVIYEVSEKIYCVPGEEPRTEVTVQDFRRMADAEKY